MRLWSIRVGRLAVGSLDPSACPIVRTARPRGESPAATSLAEPPSITTSPTPSTAVLIASHVLRAPAETQAPATSKDCRIVRKTGAFSTLSTRVPNCVGLYSIASRAAAINRVDRAAMVEHADRQLLAQRPGVGGTRLILKGAPELRAFVWPGPDLVGAVTRAPKDRSSAYQKRFEFTRQTSRTPPSVPSLRTRCQFVEISET